MATKTYTNRLADSKSPYLLQHAHNPVDWFPWCEEALEKALAENKPILVSIGYASCHWCHVMAHESFENEETARLMNEKFICIKIDREERPDLDDMFVNVVQMLTGASGWPLTIFLTPDLRPYYGGTYFPPDDTNGRPSFRRVLEHTAKIYAEHPGELTSLGNEVMGEFEKLVKGPDKPAEKISGELINETINQLEHGFDATWGGFGSPPKFPPTGALDLLMRHWRKTNNAYRLQIALTTLDQMAYGGIYDQLGGGFHRYSTDRRWLVPHFEKMLYDNALNAISYIDAFRITKKPLYHRIAKQTLDYVLRELRDPAGGFHSSQDADTEGVEGKYYVWTKDEIEKTLGAADAKLFCKFYGVTGAGNFENHTNVLNVPHTLEEFAKEVNMPESELMLQLDTMRQKLFHERATRTAPEKDDKVLCDWNALMISALCRGGQVFNDERYTRAAIQCADLLLTTMRPAGKLCHAYHHGAAHIPAFLEDYAFLLQATVDLYESTFDYKWVMCARSVAIEMIKKLWDESAGGFFITQFDEESHVPRQKSAHDQAVPSGNAIAAHALLRLARLTDNKPYRDKATKTLLLFLPVASEFPTGFTRFLCAVDFALGPDRDVIVAGAPADPRTRALVEVVRHEYQPESVFALIDPAAPESEDVENTIPLLKSKGLIEGKPTVHICENFSCRTKILSPEPLRKYLSKPPTP